MFYSRFSLLALLFLLPTFRLPAQAQPAVLSTAFSLDELQRRTFLFFWETTDTLNWQVPDRWPTLTFSSIAATGFGLSAYLVGVERGWITREQAAERVLKTLTVLKNLPQGPEVSGVAGYRGFFYHFLDLQKALRFRDVELSTIDSGLLLAGILSCQTYFDRSSGTEKAIREAADLLYRRVEWDWMLNKNHRLSMGWRPERGFIPSEWYGYNEAMILYILALGSPTHPIPADAWAQWCNPYYWDDYQGQPHLNFGPLFGHQYSHVWIDFKGIQDPYMRKKGIDYAENTRRATLANRAYCQQNPKGYKGYSASIWGLTACDGPVDWLAKNDPQRRCTEGWNGPFQGYSARGAATDYLNDDGTLSPTAVGGSLPFAPDVCLPGLQALWETYYDSLVGRYGFRDAFNPSFTACGSLPQGWFDVDYLGIDQGPIVLMIENHRSGLLWNLFKKNPYIVQGLRRAGFTGGWLADQKLKSPADILSTVLPSSNPEVLTDPLALFERHHFRPDGKAGLPYRLLRPVPKGNNDQSKYPLVIFLHGVGERGSNNDAQLGNAVLALAEDRQRSAAPCFVLAPQCPETDRWVEVFDLTDKSPAQPTQAMQHLIQLIETTIRSNPGIDPNRVYLTGLSMGGSGAFDLLGRRPDLFAAAVPLCARSDPGQADRYKKVPLWIFHGQNDPVVPVEFSRRIVRTLEKAGAKPKYTEFSTLGHAMWQETFYSQELLQWLFAQHK